MSSLKDIDPLLQTQSILTERASAKKDASAGRVYDHKKSFMFAAICAMSFGLGNYLLANVSASLGTKGIYPQCIGCTALWMLYHLFLIIRFKLAKDGPYFTKENSSFFQDGKIKLSAAMVPVQRCLI